MGGDGKIYCTLATKAKQIIYPAFCFNNLQEHCILETNKEISLLCCFIPCSWKLIHRRKFIERDICKVKAKLGVNTEHVFNMLAQVPMSVRFDSKLKFGQF